jgi:hypothetical protein
METLKKVGPYVALELFLPGGTLIALALYLFRERVSIRQLAIRLWGVMARRGTC